MGEQRELQESNNDHEGFKDYASLHLRCTNWQFHHLKENLQDLRPVTQSEALLAYSEALLAPSPLSFTGVSPNDIQHKANILDVLQMYNFKLQIPIIKQFSTKSILRASSPGRRKYQAPQQLSESDQGEGDHTEGGGGKHLQWGMLELMWGEENISKGRHSAQVPALQQ
nr:uncharacterized protein LOC105476135 [Macaca nemestrina]